MITAITQDSMWQTLADPARRDLIARLATGPATTGSLCDAFPRRTRFAVLNHLSVLKRAGLVVAEKHGREMINRLDHARLTQYRAAMLAYYDRFWDDTLARLSESAERLQTEEITAMTATLPAPGAMRIEKNVSVRATPDKVFKALTMRMSDWWGAPYLQTNDATDMVLEPFPGGFMREQSANGDGAIWGMVIEFQRDRVLMLQGRFAMRGAVSAIIRFELEPAGESGCTVRLLHEAVGTMRPEAVADFGGGWDDLLGRLRLLCESGQRKGLRADH